MISLKNLLSLTARLKEAGIDNPELEARWLVKYSRENDLENNINRRINHEPLAKILGTKGFYKYDFITTKDTLDPRCESEVLLSLAFHYFQNRQAEIKVIDICSGTGCLGLSFISEYENAKLVLLDISDKAMRVAEENAKNLGLFSRVDFCVKDMRDFNKTGFDLVLFNPPYLRTEELKTLDADTKYDPIIALDGGENGLCFYQDFNEKILSENGVLILEIGQNQEKDVENIMAKKGLKLAKIEKDIQNINRAMVFVQKI